jgi:hypothetical protein
MIKIKPEEMALMMDASGYTAVLIRPIREHIKKECKGLGGFCKKFDYDPTNFSKRKGERFYVEFEGRRAVVLIERELSE